MVTVYRREEILATERSAYVSRFLTPTAPLPSTDQLFVVGVKSRQGHHRRKDHWAGEEESEKPSCRGIVHGSHHPVEERQLPVCRYRNLRLQLFSVAAAVKAMSAILRY